MQQTLLSVFVFVLEKHCQQMIHMKYQALFAEK